ncbi:OmpA family protein [Rhodoferax sp.]|uniref:OmpA family protein n=1 Tax=Rhodoferax sp. TaxID=50421 RepID=UPI0025E552AF|nr:OmpA family protein [Rhodoferax sp.]
MFSSDDDTDHGVVLAILFGVVAAIIGLVIGLGIYKTHMPKPAAMADVEIVEVDGASVKVVDGIVKFYFATAKADIAAGANEALVEVVKLGAAGKSVRVSGFHDSTGDLAKNQELAKQRAIAVRDTLVALGVAADKIELVKPEAMTGTGSNAEARRVEVVVVQ